MSIAKRPSKITLPATQPGWNTLLDFLVDYFPRIDRMTWQARFEHGKVHWLTGEIAEATDNYRVGKVLCYYREVEFEPEIPFEHQVIFQNDDILIACKPHFLPVTPGGQYVNQCLLERIRQQFDLPELVALHRLDRETAGLVLFSTNQKTRALYSNLFASRAICKTYQALAYLPQDMQNCALPKNWEIANRLVKGDPAFLMREVAGEVNACSNLTLLARHNQIGLFELSPITGKTHQLRLHMAKIGAPILHDSFYPILNPKQPIDFSRPLQLLAKSLQFIDPITQMPMRFESKRRLKEWFDSEVS